ncbi:hypothetical protein L598_001200000660 [Mesorhizobium sp. J18]|nr:hypothetical protein L598_001200000660 [Mesorhizobium sp. J18]
MQLFRHYLAGCRQDTLYTILFLQYLLALTGDFDDPLFIEPLKNRQSADHVAYSGQFRIRHVTVGSRHDDHQVDQGFMDRL